MNEWRIVTVDGSDQALVEMARGLFGEYHAWLGSVVCSRTLGEETAALPGVYGPPNGRLMLALDEQGAAGGVIGVRSFSDGSSQAEIKRLYVRPAARGAGLGRRLAETALAAAHELGYSEALLTTLPHSMETALAMYGRLGFVETEPFYDHSHVAEGTEMLFMRRPLHAPDGPLGSRFTP